MILLHNAPYTPVEYNASFTPVELKPKMLLKVREFDPQSICLFIFWLNKLNWLREERWEKQRNQTTRAFPINWKQRRNGSFASCAPGVTSPNLSIYLHFPSNQDSMLSHQPFIQTGYVCRSATAACNIVARVVRKIKIDYGVQVLIRTKNDQFCKIDHAMTWPATVTERSVFQEATSGWAPNLHIHHLIQTAGLLGAPILF